jgi:hypothetical protein
MLLSGLGGSPGTEGYGLPIWRVSEPRINLWILDEPMGYQPPRGPRVAARIHHKQRGVQWDYCASIFNVSQNASVNWSFNWRTYLDVTDRGLDYPPTYVFYEADLWIDGGQRKYLMMTILATRAIAAWNGCPMPLVP